MRSKLGAAGATPAAAAAIMGKVFSEENATAKKRGCYAGWRGKRRYKVVGDPKSSYIGGKMHLDGQKMDIVEG